MLAGILVFLVVPHAHAYVKPLLNASLVLRTFGADYSQTNLNCTASSYLLASGVESICTQAFSLPNATPGKPGTLIAFVYSLNGSTNAQQYIGNINYDLNSTPWPQGITTHFKALQGNGTSIYFTAIEMYSHGVYLVTTAYLIHNSTILGATAENTANETSYASLENDTLALLYLLYNSTSAGT